FTTTFGLFQDFNNLAFTEFGFPHRNNLLHGCLYQKSLLCAGTNIREGYTMPEKNGESMCEFELLRDMHKKDILMNK
ncbi:hypothetical protein, partial [Desulfovibrio sp. JC022]|uniref:hypothetical protein n=1 Tax=Desulfovibrio sp. JC022 TaxID=2593642 RepID=UPI0019401832